MLTERRRVRWCRADALNHRLIAANRSGSPGRTLWYHYSRCFFKPDLTGGLRFAATLQLRFGSPSGCGDADCIGKGRTLSVSSVPLCGIPDKFAPVLPVFSLRLCCEIPVANGTAGVLNRRGPKGTKVRGQRTEVRGPDAAASIVTQLRRGRRHHCRAYQTFFLAVSNLIA
jgi:hypothetical protein